MRCPSRHGGRAVLARARGVAGIRARWRWRGGLIRGRHHGGAGDLRCHAVRGARTREHAGPGPVPPCACCSLLLLFAAADAATAACAILPLLLPPPRCLLRNPCSPWRLCSRARVRMPLSGHGCATCRPGHASSMAACPPPPPAPPCSSLLLRGARFRQHRAPFMLSARGRQLTAGNMTSCLLVLC